jgi:hypothetical protein
MHSFEVWILKTVFVIDLHYLYDISVSLGNTLVVFTIIKFRW